MKNFTMFSSVLASALMLTVASCSSDDVLEVMLKMVRGQLLILL